MRGRGKNKFPKSRKAPDDTMIGKNELTQANQIENLRKQVLAMVHAYEVLDEEKLVLYYHQDARICIGTMEFDWAKSHAGISEIKRRLRTLQIIDFAQITSNDEDHMCLEEAAIMILAGVDIKDIIQFTRQTAWSNEDQARVDSKIAKMDQDQLHEKIRELNATHYQAHGWHRLI